MKSDKANIDLETKIDLENVYAEVAYGSEINKQFAFMEMELSQVNESISSRVDAGQELNRSFINVHIHSRALVGHIQRHEIPSCVFRKIRYNL